MVKTESKLERALADPSAVFPTPESVLEDRTISTSEKVRILRRWEFDVAELAVATEEGMPHDDEDLTRRILLTLETLEPGSRLSPGPGKHHVSGEA